MFDDGRADWRTLSWQVFQRLFGGQFSITFLLRVTSWNILEAWKSTTALKYTKMSITQNGQSNGQSSLSTAASAGSQESSTSSNMNVNTFKPLLSKLLQRPEEFTPEDMREALIHVVTGSASHAQMGSFLASLRVSDVWRKPDMVQVQVQVFSELSGNIKVGGEGHICDWTLTGESRLSVGSSRFLS